MVQSFDLVFLNLYLLYIRIKYKLLFRTTDSYNKLVLTYGKNKAVTAAIFLGCMCVIIYIFIYFNLFNFVIY